MTEETRKHLLTEETKKRLQEIFPKVDSTWADREIASRRIYINEIGALCFSEASLCYEDPGDQKETKERIAETRASFRRGSL